MTIKFKMHLNKTKNKTENNEKFVINNNEISV